MIKLATLVILTFTTLAAAQDSRLRVPVQNRQHSNSHAGQYTAENMTLHLKGGIAEGQDVDVSLAGAGPNWTADTLVGSVKVEESPIPIIATVNFVLIDSEKMIFSYSIGMRQPVVSSIHSSSQQARSASINFQELMISGNVYLEEGKPVKIYSSGEHQLTLELTKTDHNESGEE